MRVGIAAASPFIPPEALTNTFVPIIRASITIGGVTISMPSRTVVSHDRKKSTPCPVSTSARVACSATLAMNAAKQKLPTDRGTMNDSSPPFPGGGAAARAERGFAGRSRR